MKRVFRIGERVYYDNNESNGWGTVILLNGTDKHKEDILCDEAGDKITIKTDSGEKVTAAPSQIYTLAPGRTFFGEPVVWEHNPEKDYPFYCPAENENCYYCELD